MRAEKQLGNFDIYLTVSPEKYDKSIKYFTAPYEEIFRQSYCCLAARLQATANLLIVGAGTGKEIL